MNFQELLNLRADRAEGPTLATLIGVGEFGRSFIGKSGGDDPICPDALFE